MRVNLGVILSLGGISPDLLTSQHKFMEKLGSFYSVLSVCEQKFSVKAQTTFFEVVTVLKCNVK